MPSAAWARSQPRRSASSWARSLRVWNRPYSSTWSNEPAQSSLNCSARYSRTCQGLSDLSAPGGASVSRFGVETKAAPPGRRSVLDRLQHDHGVARLLVALDQIAHEAHAGTLVLEPGVLEGLRVGVHPGHGAGAAGQHLAAVALAARHVHDVEAGASLRHPLVDGLVAAKPVVLGRDVGQRALAGERQRRHARRLVSLQMLCWLGQGGPV
jgi:hypothetical protein